MSNRWIVRRLGPEEANDLAELRREALDSEPMAFGSTAETDRFGTVQAVQELLAQGDDNVVFGLVQGQDLLGMTGIYHSTRGKERHKANIWGMYVRPEARRRGGARGLLDAAVEWARQWPDVIQVHLSVTDDAEAAHHLYLAAGFTQWGSEPRALCWEGDYTNERHLVLHLELPSDR